MAKVGDTVRFLNTTGGGRITRISGNIAYVEEDGFETPVLLKEIVVVLPAGHEPEHKGARLMFDQKAYDNGRNPARKTASPKTEPQTPPASKFVETASSESRIESPKPEPVELTAHGDRLSLALAFEPTDLKKLDASRFNAVFVNDSNYTLMFSFLSRSAESRQWKVRYSGEVAPNELVDLCELTHATLGEFERVAIQGIAFRRDTDFELKQPFSIVRRLDLPKFHKFHCFRPGIYFENPVLELQLMDRDTLKGETPEAKDLERLAEQYEKTLPEAKKSKREGKKSSPRRDEDNPHKLLDLIEVDLHIHELTDSIAGMSNADMLEMQLDAVRKTMKAHCKRLGQKIVFIHGKGDGVLRKSVIGLLKKEYPKCDLQDASFREYGFGATLVTVRS